MRGGGGGVGVGSGSNLKMGIPTNGGGVGGSGGGVGGGAGVQRPSKLMMMREDYHRKILKEKEQKMVQLYEDSQMNQKKAMMRLMRGGSGEGTSMGQTNGPIPNGGGSSVRDFFNERRRLEASGAPVPPIDDHFRQAKGYSSPGGWSSRTGSGNSAKKFSAGRDRSQPLAPIRRPSDTREVARTGNTPRGEKNGNGQGDPNPFNARPKLVKHKPLPPTNGYASKFQQQQQHQFGHQNAQGYDEENHQLQQTYTIDRNNNDKQQQQQQQQQQHPPQPPPSQSKFGYQGIHQHQQQAQRASNVQQHRHQPQPQLINNKNHQSPQRQQQQHEDREASLPPQIQRPSPKHQPQQRTPANTNGKSKSGVPQPRPPRQNPANQRQQKQQEPKMTDFQKWQMEQNKAREERLKKLNNNNKNIDKNQGYWGEPGDEDDDDYDDDDDDDGNNGGVYNNMMDNRYADMNQEEEEDDDDDDDGGDEDEVRRLERELLEKIEREKEELDRIRREKAVAEEEEKREIEENKKREKAERAKMKKLEEQRRKEEEQRRREEEEDERRERQREERDRREREKEEEKRRRDNDKRRKEEEKMAAKREKEEQKRLEKLQKQQAKESARSNRPSSYDHTYDETPLSSSRRTPDARGSARLTMGDIDERPAVTNAADTSYYAQIAKSSEAKGSVGSLSKCKVCGRSFAVDRLKKHQTACSKANKPRKEFDSSKKRVEGTEAAKYVGRSKREPPKKKNNWRAQHEEFINSLRYAKKAAQYEKDGKDIRELTPPPTKENPDLVPCPYCNRTFNETAAERHIPRCKDLKTKPPPMKTKRR